MKILVIANFVVFPFEGGNNRFTYILDKLDCKKNHVELITSLFNHNIKKNRNIKSSDIDSLDYKVIMINEPGYKKNVCFKRFFSHYVWGKNVIKYLNSIEKPDVIYCAIPSLTGPYNVAKYCEKNNVRFIIDVQDLWPEAFKMVFNPRFLGKFIYYPFIKIANGIYKRADEIIAVSDTYCKRALSVNKRCKKGHPVFLGTDLKRFDDNSKLDIVLDKYNKNDCVIFNDNVTLIYEDKFKLFKPSNEVWIAYCGTLGSSYDLENVITAISKTHCENLRFIIMGDGPLYDKFVNKAKNSRIKAVFTGRLPYDMMCSILCKCDIAINPIMHGAAQSIINKHADYTASGLPIVSTQECSEFCDLVDEYKMGYNCKNDIIDDIASKIKILVTDKDLRFEMGKNARRCAEERFNRRNTYNKILSIIEKENL